MQLKDVSSRPVTGYLGVETNTFHCFGCWRAALVFLENPKASPTSVLGDAVSRAIWWELVFLCVLLALENRARLVPSFQQLPVPMHRLAPTPLCSESSSATRLWLPSRHGFPRRAARGRFGDRNAKGESKKLCACWV